VGGLRAASRWDLLTNPSSGSDAAPDPDACGVAVIDMEHVTLASVTQKEVAEHLRRTVQAANLHYPER